MFISLIFGVRHAKFFLKKRGTISLSSSVSQKHSVVIQQVNCSRVSILELEQFMLLQQCFSNSGEVRCQGVRV